MSTDDRFTAFMQRDFHPNPSGAGPMLSADLRTANATEYAAYQLGQINRNLAKLISLLEKGDGK